MNFLTSPTKANFENLLEKKTKTVREIKVLANIFNKGAKLQDTEIKKNEEKCREFLKLGIEMQDETCVLDFCNLFEKDEANKQKILKKLKATSADQEVKANACHSLGILYFDQKKYKESFEELKIGRLLKAKNIENSILKCGLVLISQIQATINSVINESLDIK